MGVSSSVFAFKCIQLKMESWYAPVGNNIRDEMPQGHQEKRKTYCYWERYWPDLNWVLTIIFNIFFQVKMMNTLVLVLHRVVIASFFQIKKL